MKIIIFILILLFLLLLGCKTPQLESKETVSKPIEKTPEASTISEIHPREIIVEKNITIKVTEEAEEQIEDKGNFELIYEPSQAFPELANVISAYGLFEQTVDTLNKLFALPFDVPVVFGECGEANAFYDKNEKELIMCYELIQDIVYRFEPLVQPSSLDALVLKTTYFIFFHELGHALIDVFDLPITGKEEDVADQIATYILAESGEAGQESALIGASWFMQRAQQTEELAFWDEHALDQQRYYNIMCWLYGQDPENHDYIINNGWLPVERAERCLGEYEQMANSLEYLLGQYVKE